MGSEVQFRDHFTAQSEAYVAFRPSYPERLFDHLAGLCPQVDRVWDCACGNGQASVGLAARFEQVVATDASASQIANGAPRDNIEYRVALAEQSGLADASVSMVCVAQALHWFDFDPFWREVRRVMRPGGLLAVWTYGLFNITPSVDQIVREFYSRIVGPYWPPERALVEQGYGEIEMPFAELAVPHFEMSASWSFSHLAGYLNSWSAVRRYREAERQDPLARIEETLREAWGDERSKKTVSWPLHIRLARVDGHK